MVLRCFLTGIVIALSQDLFAQTQTHSVIIQSDRPGISDLPFLVPENSVQLESGYSYEFKNTQAGRNKRYVLNSILLRYRLATNFELRLLNEYNEFKFINQYSKDSDYIHSMSPMGLGYKILITHEKGYVPAISFLGNFNFPFTMAKRIRPKSIGGSFRFAAYNTLSRKISITYNCGFEWDGMSPNAKALYMVSVDIHLYKGLFFYVENCGKFNTDERNEIIMDTGFMYIVTPDLQIDLSGGLNIDRHYQDGFWSGGISWLFNNKR